MKWCTFVRKLACYIDMHPNAPQRFLKKETKEFWLYEVEKSCIS